MGAANGRNGGGAARRQGQPVARNRAPSLGKVDSKVVVEGLWVLKRGKRNGVKNGSLY